MCVDCVSSLALADTTVIIDYANSTRQMLGVGNHVVAFCQLQNVV